MSFSKLPNELIFIINTLEENKFEAFIVGGCVRDCLLNITPKDWDICTNAKPLEIKKIFSNFNLNNIGIKYGTVIVNINNLNFEITTYRKDLSYQNNRKPQKIVFINKLNDDLYRRDFTINAMAYNPSTEIIDPFNGKNDLKSQVISFVGNPFAKTQEDSLRILRCIRFQSTYGFNVEENTKKAIYQNSNLLQLLSSERICSEFLKILNGKYAKKPLSSFKSIFFKIIPELKYLNFSMKKNEQSQTLWNLAVNSISNCEHLINLRLALLFRHIGVYKNHCQFGVLKNYENESIQIFNKVSSKLKIPKKHIKQTTEIIKYQNINLPSNIIETCHILKLINIKTYSLILKLKKAHLKAISAPHTEISTAEHLLDKIIKNNICYSHKKMKINGSDLIKLDYAQGPNIGKTLNIILNKIINGDLQNNRLDLIKFAKQIKPKHSQ